MPAVDVLLVSPDPASRELMALAVRSIERRVGSPLRFRAAKNGELGIRAALRDRPEIVVADCCTSNRSVDACRMLSISFCESVYSFSTCSTAVSAAGLVTLTTPMSGLPCFKPVSTWPNTAESRDSASAAETAFSPPARTSVTWRDML